MKWNLDFIKKSDYEKHVRIFFREILECSTASNIEEFNKNIIDPIKMTFSYFATGEDKTSIINSEITRQQDKTINNSIGYFHQRIFQYIDGWEVPASGFDIINREKHIYVELKNKHNTMNSSSAQKTYINMQSKILDDDEAVCLLVEVIAKKIRTFLGQFESMATVKNIKISED
ncbi:MAG: Eco47II family restriction endonuclease [Bradymonadales bacterium]